MSTQKTGTIKAWLLWMIQGATRFLFPIFRGRVNNFLSFVPFSVGNLLSSTQRGICEIRKKASKLGHPVAYSLLRVFEASGG